MELNRLYRMDCMEGMKNSSLIACHNAGHEYVGFELDADYHAAAAKRIEEHKAQMRL